VIPTTIVVGTNPTVEKKFLTYMSVYPTGAVRTPVSTLNDLDGIIKSNGALVRAGGGSIDVIMTEPRRPAQG